MPLLYLLGLVEWRTLGYLFVFLAAVVSVLELLRLFGGLEWAVYDELTREYEQDNVAGYALYVYGRRREAGRRRLRHRRQPLDSAGRLHRHRGDALAAHLSGRRLYFARSPIVEP